MQNSRHEVFIAEYQFIIFYLYFVANKKTKEQMESKDDNCKNRCWGGGGGRPSQVRVCCIVPHIKHRKKGGQKLKAHRKQGGGGC